jgi:hypothetical protein
MKEDQSLFFQKKIVEVQSKIKVLKENRNEFGKYNYRSCEDILHIAKPIINSLGMTLTLTDEVKLIGERYYICATAEIYDGSHSFKNSAYAREGESQSGMSPAQITGSSSSYARKYALSGLLGLDDEKDPDTNPTQTKQHTQQSQPPRQSPPANNSPLASDAQKNALKRMNIPFADGITKAEASSLIEQANKGR